VRVKNMLAAPGWWATFCEGNKVFAEPLIAWATVDFGGDDQYVRGLVVIDSEVTDAEEHEGFTGYLPYEPGPYENGGTKPSEGSAMRARTYVVKQINFLKKKESKET
jgi:hypothetical protein